MRLTSYERVKAEAEYARQILAQQPDIGRAEALRIAAKWVRKDRKEQA